MTIIDAYLEDITIGGGSVTSCVNGYHFFKNVFVKKTYATSSGAILARSNCLIEMENITFLNNNYLQGSTIVLVDSDFKIKNCTFIQE